MRVEHFLAANASRLPGKTALVAGDRRFTFAELDDMAEGLAASLAAHGIARGDRVIAFIDNSWQAVVALFGALKAGAVFCPIAPTTGANSLAAIIEACRTTTVITEARLAATAAKAMTLATSVRVVVLAGGGAPVPEAGCLSFEASIVAPASTMAVSGDAHDPALILHGSGVRPAWLSHRCLASTVASLALDLEIGEDDVVFSAASVSGHHGLSAFIAAVKLGATLILERDSALPETVLRRAAAEAATALSITSRTASAIAQIGDLPTGFLPHLRAIAVGAGTPIGDLYGLRGLFPAARVIVEESESVPRNTGPAEARGWHGIIDRTAAYIGQRGVALIDGLNPGPIGEELPQPAE